MNLIPIDYIIQAAASLHYIRGFRKNLVRLVVYERFSHELFKKSSQALLSILPSILIKEWNRVATLMSLRKGVLTALQPRSFAAFQGRGSF